MVARKRLADPRRHEREWAFVAEVADDPAELRDEVEGGAYETRTRDVRVQPPARPADEGRYAIVEHDGHAHLAYVLELPREPGPVQEAFGIRPEASYVVAVRNPAAEAPPGVGLPTWSGRTSPELRERFGRRRFCPLDDPRLLDYEGAELVLIGAAEDVESELGARLDQDEERLETADSSGSCGSGPASCPSSRWSAAGCGRRAGPVVEPRLRGRPSPPESTREEAGDG